MAIPSYLGAGALVGSTAGASVAWPAGTAAGDLGLLLVETADQPIATPSGWTLATPVSSYGVNGGSLLTSVALQAFYKIAGASEGSVELPDAGNHIAARIATFSGVDASAPVYFSGSASASATESTSFTLAANGVNRPADTLVCCCLALGKYVAGSSLSSASNAALSGMTPRFSETTNAGNGGGVVLVTGAATGATTGITTGEVSAANFYVGLHLCVQGVVSDSAGTATPAGVAASTALGTASGAGTATATALGRSASTALGTAVASGATTGQAAPAGVAASTALGTASGAGTATATALGRSASTALGTAVASGAATGQAAPAGVAASTALGTASGGPRARRSARPWRAGRRRRRRSGGPRARRSARQAARARRRRRRSGAPRARRWARPWRAGRRRARRRRPGWRRTALGTATARGGGTAHPSGRSLLAATGAPTGTGTATTAPVGQWAALSLGIVAAQGMATATALGRSASTALGSALAQGAATATPAPPAAAVAAPGAATASGSAQAHPAGLALAAALGAVDLSARGWLEGTLGLTPALTGSPRLSPALAGTVRIYPRI